MKKKFYLVLDTETATLPFADDIAYSTESKKRIAIQKPLVYDIGWCIMERNGNIIRKENYLVQETFFVPNVFNTAYYKDKRPLYMELLKAGKIDVDTWNNIIEKLLIDLRSCDIATAYNAAFDFKKAIPFTEQYITELYGAGYNYWEKVQYEQCKKIARGDKWKGKNEEFLEPFFELRGERFPLADLWEVACDKLINTNKYREFCMKNDFLTASKQYFSTTAESSYRYLRQDLEFEEAHTALDDVIIEAFILTKALKKGKVDPQMGAFPFRKLGTTVEFVSEKRPKYAEFLLDELTDYYSKLLNQEGGYARKVSQLIDQLNELIGEK